MSYRLPNSRKSNFATEPAAEQLQAFSAYFLGDLHVNQLQLDELYAVLSAVNPTATSIFDLSAATRYASPVYPVSHQETPYVSSLSDQWRRLCHSHV